jgi:TolB-like protein/DNA-binding winged helix-turn-helix (wHTH) protein
LYEFGEFQLNIRERLLRSRVSGQSVALNQRAFETLVFLLEHRGELVSKAALLTAVWPGMVVEENNLSQSIAALRRALGDGQGVARYIVTVPGRGYQFVAAVRELSAAEGQQHETAIALSVPGTALSQPPAAGTAVRRAWPAAVAVALTLAGTVAWVLYRKAPSAAATGAVPVAAALASVAANSRTAVAVLPFANLTGDASKDYLGDGMAEELINTLARVPGLKVPARTSSFAYKGRNTNIRQIAQELGVGIVVQGSVRSAGDEIRITAQLINAADGLHIWSESYDRKFINLFKLQDDLARAIVAQLQVTLAGTAPGAALRAPPTRDLDAYRLYLQGTALLDRPNAENVDRALVYFTEAATRDPTYAQAYEGITRSHMFALGILGRPRASEAQLAEKAALRALALNPKSSAALGNLAILNAGRGRWREAMAQNQTAVATDGNDALVRSRSGGVKSSVGYRRAATDETLLAFELAPGSAFMAMGRAVYAASGEDWEAARQYLQLATDLGYPPDNIYSTETRRLLALHDRRFDEAAALFAATLNLNDSGQANTAALVRSVYAALADPGKRAAALSAAEHAYADPAPRRATIGTGRETAPTLRSCVDGAYALVLLDALDQAYSLANHCMDRGLSSAYAAMVVLWHPAMAPFRRDPRFAAYVARLGDLVRFWQESGPPDGCEFIDGQLRCR